MYKLSTKRNQVTLCKGDICLSVVGEFAKALAFVAIVGVAVVTLGQLAKVLK